MVWVSLLPQIVTITPVVLIFEQDDDFYFPSTSENLEAKSQNQPLS